MTAVAPSSSVHQAEMSTPPTCRFCRAPLTRTVVDLGMSPLCETFLTPGELDAMEPFFPLHVRVCDRCLLVQLGEYVAPEQIFTEYAYFSSYSDAWLTHAKRYVDDVVHRFGLGAASLVVELASNDGYLLQHFAPHRVPVLGVEPAANVAEAARARGVPTLVEFFDEQMGERLRSEGRLTDLVIGKTYSRRSPT